MCWSTTTLMSRIRIHAKSVSFFALGLTVFASVLLLRCGVGAQSVAREGDTRSRAAASVWRTVTSGSEGEVLKELIALASDARLQTEPFTTSWRVAENSSIEWVFPESTVVHLDSDYATLIKSALATLDRRADMPLPEKLAVLEGLWQLGERLREASNQLSAAVVLGRQGPLDKYLARLDTQRARVEVRGASMILRLLACDALGTLPANILPPGVIASHKQAVLEARRELVRDMREMQELQQAIPTRISE